MADETILALSHDIYIVIFVANSFVEKSDKNYFFDTPIDLELLIILLLVK